MTGLFDEYRLRGVRFRNRLWVPPMCQYSVAAQDGVPTDWHLVNLGSFARGGAGLVIAEATAVIADGRISPEDTGIWNDLQVDAWRRIAAFVRGQGAVAGIQLAHAGRKASTFSPWGDARTGSVPEAEGGWPTVSASAVAFGDYATPRALAIDELPGIVAAFAAAARRAIDAGFQLVEIHAAHGYLLHQFLSPLSNHRSDEYGGTLENRARLLLDVVQAVRAEVGDAVPVLIRFSASDWVEGGWDLEQTTRVAAWAHSRGADFFDISSGGLSASARIPVGPEYQVPFADHVRRVAGVPVSAVGLVTTALQAARIVQDGHADAVMMGRALLRDPHFPLRAAYELGIDVDYSPPQYDRARWDTLR